MVPCKYPYRKLVLREEQSCQTDGAGEKVEAMLPMHVVAVEVEIAYVVQEARQTRLQERGPVQVVAVQNEPLQTVVSETCRTRGAT